ncbi:MAG: hypothetical protein KGO83_07395 [Paenibacillaceae bacterium]|nr:hypothetical protein [Paenibacillaceae bacterium]
MRDVLCGVRRVFAKCCPPSTKIRTSSCAKGTQRTAVIPSNVHVLYAAYDVLLDQMPLCMHDCAHDGFGLFMDVCV